MGAAKPLAAPLGVLLGTCLVTLILANGNQQLAAQTSKHPILMGIIGFKALIWYIPLIVCGYYLIIIGFLLAYFSNCPN